MFNKLTSKCNWPLIAIITSSIIWGAASPIFKWSLENISPFTLAYLRFVIASFLLFPFTYKYLTIKKEDWKLLLMVALTGVTINISFFFWGLKFTTAINSVIIASSAPIFTLIFSIIFLKEHPSRNVWFGIFISLIGILVIFAEPFLNREKNGTILGDFLILIATLSAVAHTIATKKIIGKYPPISITFWTFLMGTITFIPLLILESKDPLWLTGLGIRGITGIFYGAIFSSTIAYFAYNFAIKKMEVSHIAVFTYLNPIVGITIAIPLLGEKLTRDFLIGALLVTLGIFLTEMHPHPFLHRKRQK